RAVASGDSGTQRAIVGGLRVGLYGAASEQLMDGSSIAVRETSNYKSFYDSELVVRTTVSLSFQLVSVLNNTKPYSSSDVNDLSGMILPYSPLARDSAQVLDSASNFIQQTDSFMQWTFTLQKQSYYILNQEKPMTRYQATIFK